MKKIITIFLAMIMMFTMTACKKETADTNSDTGNDASPAATVTSKPVTINFYEHTDNQAVAQALVDAYNAQSNNIKVKLTIIANDDYDDKIKVLLSGGADVDCFWLRGGSSTRQLADTGALLSLNDLISQNSIDTSKYGTIGQSFNLNDNTYGLCTTKSCWLLWYNKDLFDAAGESYPTNLTWDQYTALAKKLTKDDLMGGVVPNWTMNLGASAVGEYLSDPNLTRTMEYAKYLEKWYVTDQSHLSIEDMSGSFDINSVFGEGKTYMMINGDWEFQLLEDAKIAFNYGAAPLPRFDDAEEGATVGSSSCFSIAANSKYQKESFDFIKFCCYSDAGASIYAQYKNVPAYPSDAALEVYKQKVTTPGAEYVFSAKVGMEQGLESNYEDLNTAFKEELNDALVGNQTVDKAFEKYKSRRDEINSK